ncbi:MAG TPA: caspase family protein, partial [Fimbriimonadaceae bacterium]|nr:caspase family protein [Fimbriimonadaceae bacterium]
MPRLLTAAVLGFAIVLGIAGGSRSQQARDLVMAPGPMATPPPAPLYTHSYALIIGIDDYRNLPANDHLQDAVSDAKSVAEMLAKNYYFDVQTVPSLYDGQASLANIKAALQKLTNSQVVKPDDRVLIYFSGHGVAIPTSAGSMAFLIPADAPATILTSQDDVKAFEDSCLSEPQFESYLDQIPAKHVAVIADACFSGQLALGPPSSPPVSNATAPSLLQLRAHEVLAACGSGQRAWEWDNHGIFTRELLDSLASHEQSDQPFSLMNLWCEIQPEVMTAVDKHTDGKEKQVPQYNRLDSEGQFLLYSHPLAGGAPAGDGKKYDLDQDPKPLGFAPRATCAFNGAVADVRFSPDDSLMAVTGTDNSVSIFKVATGDLVERHADRNTIYRVSSDFQRVFGIRTLPAPGQTQFQMTYTDLGSGEIKPSKPFSVPGIPEGATLCDLSVGDQSVAFCGSAPGAQKGFLVTFKMGKSSEVKRMSYDSPARKAAILEDGSAVAILEAPDGPGTATLHCYRTSDMRGDSIPFDFETG